MSRQRPRYDLVTLKLQLTRAQYKALCEDRIIGPNWAVEAARYAIVTQVLKQLERKPR